MWFAGNVETALNQHIGRLADLDAIDPNRGQGIQAGKDQVPAPVGRGLGKRELARVPPLIWLERAQAADIVGVERFGNDARAHQPKFDVARHARRHGCHAYGRQVIGVSDLLLPLGEVCELPLAIQQDTAHPTLLSSTAAQPVSVRPVNDQAVNAARLTPRAGGEASHPRRNGPVGFPTFAAESTLRD
jgi:hypothetical protein